MAGVIRVVRVSTFGMFVRIGLKIGRQLREGLRVTAGYRFDLYNDRAPVHGTGVVQPFDRGTYQHTATLGVTLTNALLE